MSTMQSTVRRVEEDETRKAEGHVPDAGWQPAGPVLTDEPSAVMPIGNEFADQLPSAQLNGTHPSLPSIGHLVVYHLRDGDSRNMRTRFPATVLDCDPVTGLLSLIITVDAGDEWRQDHVPPRVAPEPGWELVDSGPNELSLNVARLGDRVMALENPDIAEIRERREACGEDDGRASVIKELFDRVTALEAKRGPGRPPNPAKPKE